MCLASTERCAVCSSAGKLYDKGWRFKLSDGSHALIGWTLDRCLECDLPPGKGDKPLLGKDCTIYDQYSVNNFSCLGGENEQTTRFLSSLEFKKFVTVGAFLYNYSALVDFLYISERVGTTYKRVRQSLTGLGTQYKNVLGRNHFTDSDGGVI